MEPDGAQRLMSAATEQDKQRAFVLSHAALLVAAAIYSGFNILAANTLGGGVSPIGFSVLRELCAFPLMYCWAAWRERPLSPPLPMHRGRFALLGIFLGAFQLCFAAGIALTDATTAAFWQCLEPTTAAILGALLRQERLTAAKLGAAILAGAGVVVLTLTSSAPGRSDRSNSSQAASPGVQADDAAPSAHSDRWLGSLLLFGQGVGIACYCLLQKNLVAPGGSASPSSYGQGYGPVTVTAHAYLVSLLVMLLAAAVDTAWQLESPPPLSSASLHRLVGGRALLAIGYAVVLSSCIGYSLRAWANRWLDASTLVLYNAVQPPLTAVLGWMLQPERTSWGWGEAAGTAMVMAAVALSTKGDAMIARCLRRAPPPTAALLSGRTALSSESPTPPRDRER